MSSPDTYYRWQSLEAYAARYGVGALTSIERRQLMQLRRQYQAARRPFNA